MRVLNFVTSMNAAFFQKQVGELEDRGIDCTNLAVAERREKTSETIKRRSSMQYIDFYAKAVRRSFGSYDIVHANYGLTAPPAVLQPNHPVVLSLWGSDLMGSVGPVSKVCAELVDEVIVMTDEMADELNGDCHVIPHGVDTEAFRPIPRSEARDKVGWDGDSNHVLFPYAASRDVKNYPRAERVSNEAGEALDDDVALHTLVGVEHHRMPFFLNAADVMLLTSRREGSPNTVKEAISCNVPVVTTDVGDVRDQLRGVAPSAVCRTDRELVDALVSILRTEDRPNGHEKVKREMSLDRMIDQVLDVYEQAIRS